MFKAFLIKYGEIGVKGKNRYLFEDALVNQIKFALKEVEGEFAVTKVDGRIYVQAQSEFDYDETVDALKRVFGIIGICPMVQIEDNGFDDLAATVVEYFKQTYKNMNFTFKVNARRARKNYPLDSMQLNAELGHVLLEAFPELKVDVHKPDVLLQVEIRQQINIYSIEIPGPGGMPVGTNGKAMLLLSGGIDSPVAGYMIAKRGVKIDATYFHAPPYTSEQVLVKIKDIIHKLNVFQPAVKLYIVPFTEIQKKIYEVAGTSYAITIMRRMMLRIAERVARYNRDLVLASGESIGQVASQTLTSMASIEECCGLPLIRPLATYDKVDIIKLSKKIDTYDISIRPYEDCCTVFVPKHPVINPKLEKCEHYESLIDYKTMIDECIKNTFVVKINDNEEINDLL